MNFYSDYPWSQTCHAYLTHEMNMFVLPLRIIVSLIISLTVMAQCCVQSVKDTAFIVSSVCDRLYFVNPFIPLRLSNIRILSFSLKEGLRVEFVLIVKKEICPLRFSHSNSNMHRFIAFNTRHSLHSSRHWERFARVVFDFFSMFSSFLSSRQNRGMGNRIGCAIQGRGTKTETEDEERE